jgi:hypothetical protein
MSYSKLTPGLTYHLKNLYIPYSPSPSSIPFEMDTEFHKDMPELGTLLGQHRLPRHRPFAAWILWGFYEPFEENLMGELMRLLVERKRLVLFLLRDRLISVLFLITPTCPIMVTPHCYTISCAADALSILNESVLYCEHTKLIWTANTPKHISFAKVTYLFIHNNNLWRTKYSRTLYEYASSSRPIYRRYI